MKLIQVGDIHTSEELSDITEGFDIEFNKQPIHDLENVAGYLCVQYNNYCKKVHECSKKQPFGGGIFHIDIGLREREAELQVLNILGFECKYQIRKGDYCSDDVFKGFWQYLIGMMPEK